MSYSFLELEYPKIQSIFKRDEKTHKFILGHYSVPEIEYLKDNIWVWTEKIDGTNIRIVWDGISVKFLGRTDDAQMPTFLLAKLQTMFTIDLFKATYPDQPLTLYGEGYGARIQKGGGNYIPKDVSFILFDVLINKWWLQRIDIEDVANKLSLKVVPLVGQGTIQQAIDFVTKGFTSTFGQFEAEGIVLKPAVPLCTRSGQRIITKVKHKDF